MSTTVSAVATWRGKMRFDVQAAQHPVVAADYFPPLGDGKGYTGLQLLLASLVTCSGQTLTPLLSKMQQKVSELSVTATGTRRDEHPTVLTDIAVTFAVKGEGIDRKKVEQAVGMVEGKFCPVWAMLGSSTKITSTIRIEQGIDSLTD